jgi:hypothetical protein
VLVKTIQEKDHTTTDPGRESSDRSRIAPCEYEVRFPDRKPTGREKRMNEKKNVDVGCIQ